MIRTVIIDDEPRSIKLVAGMIDRYCPSLTLAGTTDNLAEAVPLIENLKPSLLILDIEFPPGTVFSMLEKLIFRNFHIIFITAYNSYAAEAFRQNAVDYILKPITKEALAEAVKRVEAKMEAQSTMDLSKLANMLKSQLNYAGKIALPSGDGVLLVEEKDIIHCEASGRYTLIVLTEKKLTITKTLRKLRRYLAPLISSEYIILILSIFGRSPNIIAETVAG